LSYTSSLVDLQLIYMHVCIQCDREDICKFFITTRGNHLKHYVQSRKSRNTIQQNCRDNILGGSPN
jgi:hypothetical protein